MPDTPLSDDDNYFTVTRLPDGTLHVEAGAYDPSGVIGHIDRIIPADDPEFADYEQYAAPAAGD